MGMSATERAATLRVLLACLPEAGASAGPEEEIRAVLRPLAVLALEQAPLTTPTQPEPGTCANCGAVLASIRSPYCCEPCKSKASFVRQFRGSLANGSLLEPERQRGTGQALWALQGGGFPRRQAMVPAKVVAKVIARDGGVCQVCGATATQVAHAGSACNRPTNLRAVCASCNPGRGFGQTGHVLSEEIVGLYRELAGRVAALEPLLPCDDHERWDWRAWVAR